MKLLLNGRTAADWTAANPILLEREFGFETNTGFGKFGDGVTHWNALAYAPAPCSRELPVLAAGDGAIATKRGAVVITKAGIALLTLGAPVAGDDDGDVLTIQSATAFAHTVTTPASGYNQSLHIATFGGAVGDSLELYAYGGTWLVRRATNVVLS